jgi:uncharacterized integral membrane protein
MSINLFDPRNRGHWIALVVLLLLLVVVIWFIVST